MTTAQLTKPRSTTNGARPALVIAGTLLALAGTLLALVGGAVFAVLGGDGTVTSGSQRISTPTSALVSSVADVDGVDGVADALGDPELRLTAAARRSGTGVFVGIGPAAAVERYLASAPVEEVGDFEVEPFRLEDRELHPGARVPAPPASQRFWSARASGPESATMQWRVRDGDYRVVVMNATGARGVDVDASAGVEVPNVPTLAWAFVVVGLLLIAAGAAAIVAGLARADVSCWEC